MTNPDARSWRKAYRPGAFTFCGGGGAPLPVYRPVLVNRLDYLVLIATILAIPLYGLWRTRGSASLGQYLKRRCKYSVGHDRPVRAGNTGRADHVSFHARPGVRKRHRIYPELFRATAARLSSCAQFSFRSISD